MLWLVLQCKSGGTLSIQDCCINDTHRLTLGVIYWLMFAIVLPKWRGYALADETEALDDGTTITKVVHAPI